MEKIANKRLPGFDFIKEVSEGVSRNSRVANRTWLALIVLTLVVLAPTTHVTDPSKKNLPFQLGTVDTTLFHVVSCPMLAVLLIAFCAAHAQQVRAANLSQKIIDKLEQENDTWPHPRDIYDLMRHPSLLRVAPLAQLARGKYQFYPESHDCPACRKIWTTLYYLFLKILGIIVVFFIPSIALGFAFYRFTIEATTSLEWLTWIVGVFVIGALIASIQTIFVEFGYVFHVVKAIGGKPKK